MTTGPTRTVPPAPIMRTPHRPKERHYERKPRPDMAHLDCFAHDMTSHFRPVPLVAPPGLDWTSDDVGSEGWLAACKDPRRAAHVADRVLTRSPSERARRSLRARNDSTLGSIMVHKLGVEDLVRAGPVMLILEARRAWR